LSGTPERRLPATLAARLGGGAILIAVLATVLAVLLVLRQTRAAIASETEAALDYARLSLAAQAPLQGGAGQAAADAWAASLGRLRHLCVALDAAGTAVCEQTAAKGVPQWFTERVSSPPQTLAGRLADGRPLTVTAHARDELQEAWGEVRGLLAMILAAGGATLLLIWGSLWRGLSPVDRVVDTLGRVGRGEYEHRLTPRGPPELRRLADGVNALTDSLAHNAREHQRLLQRYRQVQEDERREVARELHDDIGQYLTALEAELASAEQASRGGTTIAAEPALRAARNSLRHVFDSVRGLLDRLRPAVLEELGLAAALDQLGQDWQRRLPGVQVRVDVQADLPREARERALQLYRIAQEAMTNVARHAAASEVRIRLGYDPARQQWWLRVADDGRGFDPDTRRGGGLGLRGMRERAQALGGELQVASAPRGGCRVEVRVPA
jgi:two-component system sensor histidine kinase UhpB